MLAFGVNRLGWFQAKPVAVQEDDGEKPKSDRQPGDGKDSDRPPHPDWIKVGGVWRPPTDMGGKRQSESAVTQAQPDPGRVEPLKRDANPHVKSMAEAIETGKFPERLSPAASPEPFDPDAYKKDPQKYLGIVEPGRVFQPAQPGPDVKHIARLGERLREVLQGETVALQVVAEPGAPVTFTSFDLGEFENKLPTITVQANDKGLAEAQFTGGKGTFNDVNILAASPVTSGRANFVVHVTLPRGVAQVDSGKN